MDITTILNNANPNIVIFIITTFIAFITWLIKSLIEKPIIDSKSTFNKYFEKRIEILTEIKTRLNFIAYFPDGVDSLEFKDQIQKILLKDGKAAYLSKDIYDSVLRISIDPTTDETQLINTIKKIDIELSLKISKIQEEIDFYRRFSNFSPLKRFIGIIFLSIQYIISIFVVISFLLFISITFFDGNNYIRFGVIIIGVILFSFIDKWLKRT